MTKDNDTADDAFWKIALRGHDEPPSSHSSDDGNPRSETHDDEECDFSGVASLYELRFLPYDPVRLRLAPLPLVDGVLSPLGSEAWYGSALLVAMLLMTDLEENRIQRHLDNCDQRGTGALNALELGSGAVGLSGLALGLLLARYQSQIDNNDSGEARQNFQSRVLLTDNDPSVLRQLEVNVRFNVDNIRKNYPGITLPEFIVHHMDWNDDCSCNLGGGDGLGAAGSRQSSLQLVVGSELVYTTETAHACAKIVLRLLKENPDVLVAIVQVADRDGWDSDFLPILRRAPGICVQEESPIQTNAAILHEAASKLIQHGGTLDYLSCFAVCYISNLRDD
jgi:Lysine methyltransferase